MEFYINDEKIDVSLEDERTVGDVLKSLELTCQENEAEVIGIQIDGQKVTAEIFDEIAQKELSGKEKFEFSVITKKAVFESFKRLSELFRDLSAKMESVPLELQTGRDKEAHSAIKVLADSIEDFCHVATLSSLFSDFTEIKINGMEFSAFFADFQPILKDFEDALKNNDTVTVGDLAEYEICPRLISIAETLENI
ncbi:MAG: hypothetical protein K6E78_10050 [Treponema sp.]|nr:hypothetical protein [Treponema sp.]